MKTAGIDRDLIPRVCPLEPLSVSPVVAAGSHECRARRGERTIARGKDPSRNNAMRAAYAAAIASRRDIPVLVGGMCETD
jgi:hypothetical protein